MIGIFDSGLGGLTVAKAVMRKLPGWPIIYFGDTARTPYGNKSKAVIERYALENTRFLLKKGAKIIIIACNTASALAYEAVKKKYPRLSVFEVITPAVNEAARITKNNRVGIIGTRATIASGIYQKKLKNANKKLKIFEAACPLLVSFVEENWLDKPVTNYIVEEYLHPLRKKNIDTLILGCTHYPLIKDSIRFIIGRQVNLVDSAEAVAKEVAAYLIDKSFNRMSLRAKRSNPGHQRDRHASQNAGLAMTVYVSDLTPHFASIAAQWFGRPVKIELESPS